MTTVETHAFGLRMIAAQLPILQGEVSKVLTQSATLLEKQEAEIDRLRKASLVEVQQAHVKNQLR